MSLDDRAGSTVLLSVAGAGASTGPDPHPPKLDLQALDPVPLLTTIFAMLGFSARAAGVRLTLDMPPRGLHLLGDRSLLLEVLLNLVTNATQAVAAGGLVALAARRVDERDVVLEIAANGPGIPGEVAARIWKPRLAQNTEGPDLASVRSLVNAMGGTIQLECAPPWGTLCRLTFPTAPVRFTDSVRA